MKQGSLLNVVRPNKRSTVKNGVDLQALKKVTAKFLKKDYQSEKSPSKSKSPLKSKAKKAEADSNPASTTESVNSKASRSRTPRRSKRISRVAATAVSTLSSNTRNLVLNALRGKQKVEKPDKSEVQKSAKTLVVEPSEMPVEFVRIGQLAKELDVCLDFLSSRKQDVGHFSIKQVAASIKQLSAKEFDLKRF